MFFQRVTLFRFFGFKVKADASWIFLSIFISWTLATRVFPGLAPGLPADTYQWMGVAALAGLLFSIIAHEVAHAVIAEYYHMPIASITLFVFGGVAEMKGEPSHAKGEFFMAVAGPIMSALLGFIFWAAAALHREWLPDPAIDSVLEYLGDLNMLIALFNMVPAFPLDGGRALRALIWKMKNNLVLATRVASQAGAVFAYGLMAYGGYKILLHDDLVSGAWMTLLGLFVHGSGAYAVRQTESRSLLASETVARFLDADIQSISPDLTVSDFVEKYVYEHYQSTFPVIHNGQLTGVVTLQGVLALDRSKWQWLHIASVMDQIRHGHNTVAPDVSAADALDLLQRHKRESLLVEKDGQLHGVVAYRDLAAFLSVTMKFDQDRPVATSR